MSVLLYAPPLLLLMLKVYKIFSSEFDNGSHILVDQKQIQLSRVC